MKKYSEYIELLKENHNLVLTGAPGTGKTFMAQAIAEEMGCGKDEMCFVQFHPSYDYTDFVEGLRSGMSIENPSFGFFSLSVMDKPQSTALRVATELSSARRGASEVFT